MSADDSVSLDGPVPERIPLDSPEQEAESAQNIDYVGLAPARAFDTEPYNPARIRENFRGLIALILIGLMAGIIIAVFALFWIHPDRIHDLKDLFGLIFGPVVALVGAATGYYFGSQSTSKN